MGGAFPRSKSGRRFLWKDFSMFFIEVGVFVKQDC